jgi:hypothetical protein
VQVAASTAHATWRLVAVSPDVAKLLTVVTLSEAILGFVPLYLNGDMTEACQFENYLGFRDAG